MNLFLYSSLKKILKRLKQGETQMGILQDKIEALKVEVSELTTVVNSAVTLITGLADLIRENATAPAQLEELAAGLDAQAATLAAAVTANTPTA